MYVRERATRKARRKAKMGKKERDSNEPPPPSTSSHPPILLQEEIPTSTINAHGDGEKRAMMEGSRMDGDRPKDQGEAGHVGGEPHSITHVEPVIEPECIVRYEEGSVGDESVDDDYGDLFISNDDDDDHEGKKRGLALDE